MDQCCHALLASACLAARTLVSPATRIGSVLRNALLRTNAPSREVTIGLPGRVLGLAAKVPGGLWLTMIAARTRVFRRGPGAWGWMSKRPVPREVMDAWFAPATANPAIRRDLARYGNSIPPKKQLLDLAERMRGFERPVLVAWAVEDKLMPREHGRRLAELFPHARLVEIEDSYTLIPEDQPEVLAGAIREFVADRPIGPNPG
jgi:pimeloyl-ACP methyl ester carboxylesterase